MGACKCQYVVLHLNKSFGVPSHPSKPIEARIMPTVGDTLTFRSGRQYLVCSITATDAVLRSDDGLTSIVWTRDLVDAIHEARITCNPSTIGRDDGNDHSHALRRL